MKETSNTHLKEKIQALPMLYLRLVSIRAHNMCSIDIFCQKIFHNVTLVFQSHALMGSEKVVFLVIFIHPFENSGGYFFRGRLF